MATALKVTAVPVVSALGQDEEEDDLEVLVRVEAPQAAKHPPVDLVVVVDVSGSMSWLPDQEREPANGEKSRMDYLKAALEFIIKELHDDDRLSIVQFNQGVKGSTPLKPISGGGRESASKLVRSLSPDGGTVFKPALEEAVSILQGRGGEDSIRRVPFIIFLSDGEENHESKDRTQWEKVMEADSNHPLRQVLGKYPVHTFGFSSFHDPVPLMAIARVSCGTYSYIDGQGLDKITDAFAVCLGGLTTVVIKDATIALSAATPGVTIVGIDSGGYDKVIEKDGESGKIRIPVLYEREVKNFIVHLRVPRAEASTEEHLLLTTGGAYVDASADHDGASTTTIGGDNHRQLIISIQRPAGRDDGDGQQRDEAVLEQVTRFKLLSLLEKLPKDKQLHHQGAKCAQWLREKWSELKKNSFLSNKFDTDVEVMVGKLAKGSGQSFVCSYVSSHQMERTTMIGSHETSIAVDYMTPPITEMAKRAAIQKNTPPPPEVPPPSWKEWLSSASWLSVISSAWNNGGRVKVEAFTGSSMVVNIVGDSKHKCTPVLVRVTAGAPWRRRRTPVDVVAVLNISSGMKGSMEQMQEAMGAIISNLDNKDRLSLVLLEDVVSDETGLIHMDSKGRVTASDMVKRKTTSTRKFRECGENLSKEALEIVRHQIGMANEASHQDRLRCVMLLSGGQDKLTMEDWIADSKEHRFQFHAFDLGAQHDAGRFQCLADQLDAGTYHYLGADAKVVIKDAFTAFVVGLKSVVATSVKLSLKAEAGFSISSVETEGHYCCSTSEHARIHIADMYAGEQRSFMVYLSAGGGATAGQVEQAAGKLLSIDVEYLQAGSSNLLRGKVEAHELMEEKWKTIRASAEYEEAHGTDLRKIIDKDMDQMMQPQRQSHMMSTKSIGALGIAGVVVLALVAMLLLWLLVGGGNTTWIAKEFNVTLNVTNHPQWPAMEGGLSATLHMVQEDTSFFKGVTPIVMIQQIDQYLYMAILYAAALRTRYNSTTDLVPHKVLRGHAQAYLQAMLQRINKNDALSAMQLNSVQHMSNAMSQHLYSATVQTHALVTMHPPPLTPEEIIEKQKYAIAALNNDRDTLIADRNTLISDKNTLISEKNMLISEKNTLSTEIVTLKIDIEKMQNCCQLAKRCERHVKELGGSTDYFGDYVTKTTYSVEFERKELSAHEAVEYGHQKIKELQGAVQHNKVDKLY